MQGHDRFPLQQNGRRSWGDLAARLVLPTEGGMSPPEGNLGA